MKFMTLETIKGSWLKAQHRPGTKLISGMKKSKKTFLIHLLFTLILCITFNLPFLSFAQEDPPDSTTTEVEDKNEESKNPAFEVLGRKLTKPEKLLYGNLGAEGIKNALLHKEQRLVIVRAVVATGNSNDAGKVLSLMHISELITYRELIDYFYNLIERYGSVVDGLLAGSSEDPEAAFKNAASIAYEEVYGVPREQQNIESILSFFKAHEVSTYTEMIDLLVSSMTQEDKVKLLKKALAVVGRLDLIGNKKFVNKIISQKFTYGKLLKLLRQIPLKGSVK